MERSVPALVVILLSLATLRADGTSDPAGDRTKTTAAPRADATLTLQIRLDRAGFSPGEIDGQRGANTARAVRAFQRAHGLRVSGKADSRTLARLRTLDSGDVLTTYRITAADASGPFTDTIPADLLEQANLPALGYTSLLEMLGERFHASPRLLQRLNPKSSFEAGDTIHVPDVKEPAAGDNKRAVVVSVSKAEGALTIETESGQLLFHAPVTTGSEHNPLPIGDWTVTGVLREPVYHYNPELFWDADPAHAKAKIAPGPNNPVGVVWIDLSREHYGLHGTPEPASVGRTQSHGCVRLTNWDASRVASFVKKGTRVAFRE